MADFSKGDKVEWIWAEGTANGEVVKRYNQNTTVTIKGTEVTRDASKDQPAFLIKQDDGDQVLKSASELSAA